MCIHSSSMIHIRVLNWKQWWAICHTSRSTAHRSGAVVSQTACHTLIHPSAKWSNRTRTHKLTVEDYQWCPVLYRAYFPLGQCKGIRLIRLIYVMMTTSLQNTPNTLSDFDLDSFTGLPQILAATPSPDLSPKHWSLFQISCIQFTFINYELDTVTILMSLTIEHLLRK